MVFRARRDSGTSLASLSGRRLEDLRRGFSVRRSRPIQPNTQMNRLLACLMALLSLSVPLSAAVCQTCMPDHRQMAEPAAGACDSMAQHSRGHGPELQARCPEGAADPLTAMECCPCVSNSEIKTAASGVSAGAGSPAMQPADSFNASTLQYGESGQPLEVRPPPSSVPIYTLQSSLLI